MSKENLEIQTTYQDNKRLDLEKIKWGTAYSGILVGPIAHKIVGLGDHSSVLKALDEEGFPPYIAIRNTARELKITKTSLQTALKGLLNTIGKDSSVATVH